MRILHRLLPAIVALSPVIACEVKSGSLPASSLVVSEKLGPGTECAAGGIRVVSGTDANGDGKLDAREATGASTLCNEKATGKLVRSTSEPAGAHCASGGLKVEFGVDDGRGGGIAGDGQLQDGEVESTAYMCNGTDGANGKDGLDGKDGKDGTMSLVTLFSEPAGVHCPHAGTKIASGIDDGGSTDAAGDGVLGFSEVRSIAYVCNPAPVYPALVEVVASTTCTSGGYVVRSGRDDGRGGAVANDGVLSNGEVENTATLCNGEKGDRGDEGETGARGFASLVRVTDAGAACAAGGKKIESGIDDGLPGGTADDGVLDDLEVDASSIVCNGVAGANGANGANGADGTNGFSSLVVVTDAGAACPAGGKQIQTGLDDGAPSGTARDGILQPGEVDATSTVCNGSNGTNGADGNNGTDGVNGFVSLVAVSDAGASCPNGGKKIESGLDDGLPSGTANNGVLEAGEVTSTSFVCNGVAGVNGINGTNGSNGTDGTDGSNGTNGYNTLVSVSDGAAGCASGGKRIDTGLDDGLPSGVARDAVLQPGEIDSTSFVCNGAAGSGSGLAVYDGTNTMLGELMSTGTYGVTVRTPQGYFVDYAWNGTFFDGQIYYSAAGCNSGTRWLNAGGSTGELVTTRWVYWEGSTGDFLVAQDNGTANDGLSVSVSFTGAASMWSSGTCGTGGNNSGWPLSSVTRPAAGIPASISMPLTIR